MDDPTNLFYWHDGVIKQVPQLAAQLALPGQRDFRRRKPPIAEDANVDAGGRSPNP